VDTGLQALGLLKRLREVCHPDCHRWNPIDLYDHMASAEGRVAYSPLAFGYTNYARPGYAERQLSFGGIPGRTHALLGGAGIAISSSCLQPQAAADYLSWLCGAEYQRTLYVEHGGQPGNGAAWSDDRANELAGSFFSRTRDTIETAYMRPRSAQWPVFQEFLGDRVHEFLLDDENPQTVLGELQQRYEQIPGR
jgi:multiple sugar transport system substrate-binding protein